MGHPYFEGFDAGRPMILGHRGAAGTAPENTLLSLERCLSLGAHAIESDVQVTADGVPVLLHDPDLQRVSDRRDRVSALEWGSLREINAAYHFSIDDRGTTEPDDDTAFRAGGHRVPSLDEAFQALPKARFNLEVKTAENDAIARVVALVASHDRADRTLLTAGDDAIMQALRKELEAQGVAAATSACVSEIVAFVRSAVAGEAPPAWIESLQIPTHFGGNLLVTPSLVEHAHRHGVEIHVWTINDPEEMHRLLDRGVDGLVTDFPGRAASLAKTRAERA
jgi:glycerophosphoryl diester phosphodiesterase